MFPSFYASEELNPNASRSGAWPRLGLFMFSLNRNRGRVSLERVS
jgi:hypothetical protein